MVNQSLFQKKVLDALSPYKLTAGQPKVLDYLGKHNGCIQKSIATRCQIERLPAYCHAWKKKSLLYVKQRTETSVLYMCI